MRTLHVTLMLLLCCGLLHGDPVTVQPTLNPALRDSFRLIGGDWDFRDGEFEQKTPERLAAALLTDPACSDTRLTVDFNIHPTGNGVRAAALILRATGTMTYYWVHLDGKNHTVILTRSTKDNTWIEIGRAGCAALTVDAWHTAVAELKNGELIVSLDGAEVIKRQDSNIAAGRIGVGTSQGQVSFRNLKVEGERVAMEPLKEETPQYKVISRGEASGPYQAFPDACRLQNGDIMVVYYAGYGHVSLPNDQWPKGGRIATVRSSDEGRTWTTPAVLYDDAQDNRDPHIAQLKDGTLICSFFNYWRADNQTRFRCYVSTSTDGGKTWAEGQPVTPEMWALSAPVRELPDGTLVLGIYTEGADGAYGGVVRSTDHGKTWSEPIPIGKEAKQPLDAETDLILLKDGSLFAALRSSSVNMYYALSKDQGKTWEPAVDIGFKGHAPHLTRLSTGEILMTHRIPATALHVSRDDAKTWQGPYVIDTVGGAYPATVELKDGSVLAIYYEEGEGSAIRALRFKLKADGIEFPGW